MNMVKGINNREQQEEKYSFNYAVISASFSSRILSYTTPCRTTCMWCVLQMNQHHGTVHLRGLQEVFDIVFMNKSEISSLLREEKGK